VTEATGAVQLYLLRHADAGDPETWRGDDDVRPLSPKGVRQAERLGRHLAAVGFAPDTILSSPLVRALQTAEIVGRALGVGVVVDERLANHVGLELVERVLHDAGRPRRPVLVGHDPSFSDLVTTLIDARPVPMKKGALARIDVAGELRAGAGVLRWLLPPDLVPREG
jgi:phosphohistidine phosphatase